MENTVQERVTETIADIKIEKSELPIIKNNIPAEVRFYKIRFYY